MENRFETFSPTASRERTGKKTPAHPRDAKVQIAKWPTKM
jgi:hypothetical protein